MLPISHLCIIATDARIRSRISCIKFPFFFLYVICSFYAALCLCVCSFFVAFRVSGQHRISISGRNINKSRDAGDEGIWYNEEKALNRYY